MFRAFLVISLCLISLNLSAAAEAANTDKASFIHALMEKMTVDEKIGQLNLLTVNLAETGPSSNQGIEEKIKQGRVGALMNAYSPQLIKRYQSLAIKQSRLKIPLLFGFDVIHGYRTTFPIPLAQAASWNPALIQQLAHVSAIEAASDGIHWTFSPMVDIVRDPRWGRVMESAGEDPYLASKVAEAMVIGYQGENLKNPDAIMACVKHFALYGAAEAGRDYNTVDMSPVRMANEYLPPYLAAIKANAGSVMAAFNEVNGIPATANRWLLKDLLRDSYHFKGLLVTDYTAIKEMTDHGIGDEAEVSRLALEATTDMDMVSELYSQKLAALLAEKKISLQQIDAAVQRVLAAKWDLGLFDDPYRQMASLHYDKEKHQQLARQAARESMILLKNKGQILPLKASRKIAFIGPFVKDANQQLGEWRALGDASNARSLWDGLQQEKTSAAFLYAKGANFSDDPALTNYLNEHGGHIIRQNPHDLVKEAVQTAKKAEIIVAVLGEPFGMSGEAASRTKIGLLPNQMALLKALKKLNKPLVLILMNGRPLTLEWADREADAILEAWYGGSQAGPAIADILFGRYNPSAKLTMTFPRRIGQIPIYYNAKPTGRPYLQVNERFAEKYKSKYIDASNLPRYPFGYGLSYSHFNYADLRLSTPQLKPGGKISLHFTLKNTGPYDGEEIVQLYLHQAIASITQPQKLLKGFQKVFLKKGEQKELSFEIDENMLAFYNQNMERTIEAGRIEVFVGPDSQSGLKASFNYQQK